MMSKRGVVIIRLFAVVISSLVLLAGGIHALAEEPTHAVVEWKDVGKYVDIRAVGESQKRFEQRVFDELGSHIVSESADLVRKGQQLIVTVHNLDLAGEIRMNAMGSGNFMRIIREPTLMLIELEYKLVDTSNKVLISGQEVIRGNHVTRIGRQVGRTRPFDYEKQMISNWMAKNLKPKLAHLRV